MGLERLRTRLTRNARSTGYWARYHEYTHDREFTSAGEVCCACTEPDSGYSLKDQCRKVIELEDKTQWPRKGFEQPRSR